MTVHHASYRMKHDSEVGAVLRHFSYSRCFGPAGPGYRIFGEGLAKAEC